MWMNPNDNVLRLKLLERQYAESFMERGCIKFSTPKTWEEYQEKNGDGRGDIYEGTLAFCDMFDVEKVMELGKKYAPSPLNPNARQLIQKIYNQRILFKDRRSMQLPCYCLYVMRVDDFPVPNKAGEQILKTIIPGSFFQDFVDNLSEDEVKRLPAKKEPALIMITDFESFLKRLKQKLYCLGVKENEILISYASYFDFEKYGETGWYDFQQKYPNELFIKNARFKNQSEGRIIVNTTKQDIINQLKNPIELGSMDDIAQIKVGYFPKGVNVEINTTIISKK